MAEVYANMLDIVRHYPSVAGASVPADGTVTYEVVDAAGAVVAYGNAEKDAEENFYEAFIPPGLGSETQFELVWRYELSYPGNIQQIEISEELFVVTPYLSVAEVMSLPDLEDISAAEAKEMERLVAGVIDVYCNQTFSRENEKAFVIQGQDSDQLALPKRIINLTDVEVLDDPSPTQSYSILEYTTFDPDAPWILRRKRTAYAGRSMNPVSRYRFFKYPDLYRVSGDWGWNRVPRDVVRAATILMKDYFCDDSKYREKFIDNIRAGDWRMEFRATGDETTGNANADMLLTGYRNVAMAVI